MMTVLRHLYPVVAFLGGFVWDALTIGQRVRVADLWRLGGFLLGACVLVLWLSHREASKQEPPPAEGGLRGTLLDLAWQAPNLLLQFFYGGIFSALFISYFKSSGHLGTWLTTALLGVLLVGNEFVGRRYGRHFTLAWLLLALNSILFFNFALPHAVGSLNPLWFYVSTATGILLTHLVWRLSPRRPGRIGPAWILAATLLLAWKLDMIAPVPLVKEALAVGHEFARADGRFSMQVEQAPSWQIWRDQSPTVHVADGETLYGVSAVYAPLGVSALLEHRWEVYESGGWRLVSRRPFESTGGRERGFRGYSWVPNPQPGEWRLTVATQDGRTIGTMTVDVERGVADPARTRVEDF
jgi:hypothetical protein